MVTSRPRASEWLPEKLRQCLCRGMKQRHQSQNIFGRHAEPERSLGNFKGVLRDEAGRGNSIPKPPLPNNEQNLSGSPPPRLAPNQLCSVSLALFQASSSFSRGQSVIFRPSCGNKVFNLTKTTLKLGVGSPQHLLRILARWRTRLTVANKDRRARRSPAPRPRRPSAPRLPSPRRSPRGSCPPRPQVFQSKPTVAQRFWILAARVQGRQEEYRPARSPCRARPALWPFRLPVRFHRLLVGPGRHRRRHGVAANELLAHGIDDVGKIEQPCSLPSWA